MSETFRGLLLRQDESGAVSAAVEAIETTQLPADGDVTVAVEHSSINYKDGLTVNGLGRIVRHYPFVPGIDFAGTVEASDNPGFAVGDKVICTGWRVGEVWWGGLAEKARVKGEWLVHQPKGVTSAQAMAAGTAGLTAALSIAALEANGVSPDKGPILVTGASGGVGSFSVLLLRARGYEVVAVSGDPSAADYFQRLGVSEVIPRSEYAEPLKKPLEKERWAGCIDNAGGVGFARIAAQMCYGGSIAAVGLAAGSRVELELITLFVRAVTICGIDSVQASMDRRTEAWRMIEASVDAAQYDDIMAVSPLSDAPSIAKSILKGGVRGRAVIDVNA